MHFFPRRLRAHRFGGLLLICAIATMAILAALAAADKSLAAAGSQFARIDYNVYTGGIFRHSIFIELFDDRPITTANFLQYVNANKYDFSIMHRLASGFVIQGGGFYPQFISEPNPALAPIQYSLNPNLVVDLDGNSSTPNPTIANEFAKSPARLNERGTLSMAQTPGNPNSATSQWFINLANNANLDVAINGSGPYTVFGRVAGDGMSFMDSLISKLTILNLNPDTNDDGVRESGPFYTGAGDGTPVYISSGSIATLQLVNAEQIDYFGPDTSTVVDGSWSLSARNSFIDAGAQFAGAIDNRIVLGPNRSLQIREGFSFGRDLESHGTVAPGLQIGTVTTRNYIQDFDGTLEIDIAGPTLDTQYDRVVATGAAYLSGKLDVNFVLGYTPALNTAFSVVNADQIVGQFLSYDLPQLAAGLVWKLTKSNTAFTLTVAGGDYNRNGIVDAADYALWRKTKGSTVAAGTGADGDANGLINDYDYLVWRSNFGNLRGITSGSGAGGLFPAGVPEPASAALAAFAAIALLVRPRRRAQHNSWIYFRRPDMLT